MPRWYKAIITGLLIGALGVLGGVVPFGFNLEENIGLDLMFRLRGFRHPPSNVVIVSLDKATVDALQLPANPYKWPRSLHANLIKNLVKKGASVIVFDMMFNEPSALDQDNLFAQAVREAGIEIHYPDKAPFVEKVKPLLEEYKKDPALLEIIESIQNQDIPKTQ